MALRSRLNRSREKRNDGDLPEEEGGSRNGNKEKHEVEMKNKSHIDESEIDDSNDTRKDKNFKDKDKDSKNDTPGRSIASRFRRNKEADDKPTDEEEDEQPNSRFRGRDGDSRRDDDNKERDRKTNVDKGSKLSGDHHGSDDTAADHDSGHKTVLDQQDKDLEQGPMRVLQPIRTDPVLQLKTRHKKLERLTAEFVPEIHIIGNILSGSGIVLEDSEGASCR